MPHPYGDIPELTEHQAGGPLVRIPDRLSVAFTPRVRAIVDTAEFQRLAHISQLGLAAKIYPGATHSRFEHALGVFHNACRYLWQLGKDPRFAAIVDPHHAEVMLTTALLHDIGHWPFCHPIEDLQLPGVPSHEEFAATFLNPKTELGQVLEGEWRVTPHEVLELLCPGTGRTPKTDTPAANAAGGKPSSPPSGTGNSDGASLRARPVMRSILSGPIDIDKMDYLERDSWHCGVPYGRNFDRDRLIQSLVLNADGNSLAITTKGKTAAELMVFARYVMFSEVYWHHAVRSATTMLARSFFEVHRRLDVAQLFCRREADFVAELQRTALGTAVEPLLTGLFGPKRRLHKRVLEFSASQQPDLYCKLSGRPYTELVTLMQRLTEALSRELGQPLGPADVLIDAPPAHREVEFRVDVLSPKEGVYRPLGAVSPVVAALAQTQFDESVKRVRVFATACWAPHLTAHRVAAVLAKVA